MENGDTSTKVYTPREPQTHADLVPPAPLVGTQEEKRLLVLAHFSKEDYVLPDVEADKAPLMEAEKFWLTNDCILRYLRATKWDTTTAISRLEGTLKWRREFGFHTSITPEHVEPEGMTGKEVVFGFDKGHRPGLYMFPSRQNTEESNRQVEYATFMLERTIDLTPPGIENVALFINYGDKSPRSPSLSMSRNVLHILQTHYPERLGRAYIINIPFLLNAFFKIIMPLVDPVTREKVKFNPKVVAEGLVDADMLMNASGWGGAVDFEYNHEKYWPALMDLCKKRKEEQMDRWRKLGAKVGIDEWAIKGGPSSPSQPDESEKTPAAETNITADGPAVSV
ncbi:CRAL/TRIO domain-containing protein [Serendipita vermifera]|nr:CRAL/TRIO domain-containing protein [Serendipita vermifera]